MAPSFSDIARIIVKTGRSVVVRINDRGPVQRKFEIDLSRGSARVIGVLGVSTVEMYAAD